MIPHNICIGDTVSKHIEALNGSATGTVVYIHPSAGSTPRVSPSGTPRFWRASSPDREFAKIFGKDV